MKIGRYIVLAAALGVGGWAAVRWWNHRPIPASGHASGVALPTYDNEAFNTRAPDSVRIKVEVLNASNVPGLARRATFYLRDRGFDVVSIGNTKERYTQTIVLDRSGHPERAALVAKAMQGRSQSRPDTSRYLDASVLVGRDWTPPPEPFYP